MRVSIVQLNLVLEDAIGACAAGQVRFFRRRGDDVQVFVQERAQGLPEDLASVTSTVTLEDLLSGHDPHFRLSDLFVFHYPGYYKLLESMRAIDRGTVIFYYHNVTPPELWGSDLDSELLIDGLEQTRLVQYADLCITDSPFNKQDLVERVGFQPDLISVLPLAIELGDAGRPERNADLASRLGLEGHRVLLFVGRMAGNKRVDLLVEALAQLRGSLPDLKLLLVGDNDSAAAYREVVAKARARAEELGVGQDVVFTGRVDSVRDYFGLADVYVTASLHEGFGVPLIEAMAYGVPVVASRSGAMPWVVSDAGLLFEPGDSADLAAQVNEVLTDDDLRLQMTQRGFQRSKAFSRQRYEAALAAIVDDAVKYTLPQMTIAPGSWAARQSPDHKDGAIEPGRAALGMGLRAEVPEGFPPELLQELRGLAWINPHLPIAWPDWPKGVGPKLAALAQKLIRRSLRWYINPLVDQQNKFNATVVRAIEELAVQTMPLGKRPVEQPPEGDSREP